MRAAIGVFARAPVAGETKTRLIPALGAEGAARLHEAFLRDVLQRAARVAPVTLFVAGAMDHPTFESLLDAPELSSVRRVPQVGADLGERMREALQTLRAHASAAFLVGSDVPTFPERLLRAVARRRDERVLTPTTDGGYALVGGRAGWDFEGVCWSRPTTLAETLRRNPGARLTEPWYDVDEPADLELLRLHLDLDPSAAPATALALAAMVA